MSVPELWTRCPNAVCEVEDYGPDPQGRSTRTEFWYCECHGDGMDTMLRVPLDQAAERMADYLRRHDDDEQAEGFYLGRAYDLLRAALGEEPT